MKRWYGLNDAEAGGTVVAIGVYDGVHRGHRLLIRRAMAAARANGQTSVVVTFEPNPAEVVRPDPPKRVSTLAQRLDLLEWLGVDATLVVGFDSVLAGQSPQQFVEQFLVAGLGASQVVVGENFRFGYRASGDIDDLRRFGAEHGFTVDAVPLLRQGLIGREDVPISSSEIRRLVAEGDVAAAARGLARPHRVEGIVVLGDQRGRELGYPTANVDITELAAVPADGVYAGRLVLRPYAEDRRYFPAAISVGTNPTFKGQDRRVEAFVIDAPADFDIYGTPVAVDFVSRLRPQQSFGSAELLKRQMAEDVKAARDHLGLG